MTLNELALRYTTKEYEKLQICLQQAISRYSGLHDAGVETIEDWATNTLVLRLHAYVWSSHDEITVEWPATWWEHLKQRLNERFGWKLTVRMQSRLIPRTLMHPDITMKSPFPTLRINQLNDRS